MFSKTVLITGGAGFIGSHVVIYLVRRFPSYCVINLDKLDYVANLKNLECIEEEPNYKFIKGDITDSKFMRLLFEEERIDYVLHCAAKSHVEDSFFNPLEFTQNNVLGTHILLNSAFTYGNVKLFLHISTDEVYGGKCENHMNYETTMLQPTNPYAATKAAAESIVMSYWESFKFPVIVTRMNNVYGPHQHPEKVIPKFIELLKRKRKCYIQGSGLQSRSFLYVTDAVSALVLLLLKGQPGEIYNVGSDFEISMKDLAFYLSSKILKGHPLQAEDCMEYVPDRPFNDMRYRMNSDKVKSLGWRQQVTWEEGVQKTIQWHHDHPNQWPLLEEILKPHLDFPKLPRTLAAQNGEANDEQSSTGS